MPPSTLTINHPSGPSFEFVWVEGGEFNMGDDDSEFEREKPAHRIKLSGFYIGKYPVTQGQYNPNRFMLSANYPATGVSWNDVQDFIQKLNEQTKQQFRLPTEAEWEYAARGGKYSQGYSYSGSDKLKQVAWYEENSSDETHEVGLLLANELGIHDMNGNVWEWCADGFVENYYRRCQQQGVVENPMGPNRDMIFHHVLRGGSSIDQSMSCRVASRFADLPVNRELIIGFRLCFSLSVSG